MNANLKTGEVVVKEDQNKIVVLKQKIARDARLISTKPSPVMVEIENCKNKNKKVQGKNSAHTQKHDKDNT